MKDERYEEALDCLQAEAVKLTQAEARIKELEAVLLDYKQMMAQRDRDVSELNRDIERLSQRLQDEVHEHALTRMSLVNMTALRDIHKSRADDAKAYQDWLFETQEKRMGRARKLWQDAHGKPDTRPDLGILIEWLVQRGDEAIEQVDILMDGDLMRGVVEIESELEAQSALIDMLSEALDNYGTCYPDCASDNGNGLVCDCGLSEAKKLMNGDSISSWKKAMRVIEAVGTYDTWWHDPATSEEYMRELLKDVRKAYAEYDSEN